MNSIVAKRRWLVAVLLASGCRAGEGGPEAFPVSGAVTRGGVPVAGATVTFAPTAADGAGAQATTDADGKFDVQATFDGGKTTKRGLPAGDYRITVIKMEMPAGSPSLSNPPRNVLPAKYADPKSSGLNESVAAGIDNHFEFRLDP